MKRGIAGGHAGEEEVSAGTLPLSVFLQMLSLLSNR